MVVSVVQVLGYSINKSMMDACHYMYAGGNNDKTPEMYVKIVRKIGAQSILVKRRMDIGMTGQSGPIYINESLAVSRRKLFNAACVV